MKTSYLNRFFNNKAFCCFIVVMSISTTTYSQSKNYFNEFVKHFYTIKNIDSAYYDARQLAKKDTLWLQTLMHDEFVQSFIDDNLKNDNSFAKSLLTLMMKDTNKVLVETLTPIDYLVKVQENSGKPYELKKLVREYLNGELKYSKGYPNRIERYALLIHQILVKQKRCKGIADSLFNSTMGNLARYLADTTNFKKYNRGQDRAWGRYLYAYCNYLLANKSVKSENKYSAAKYYKTASDFSPDELDINANPGYYYEMNFLFKGKPIESFKDTYLAFLKEGENKTEILKVMTEKAVTDPAKLEELKIYYNNNYLNSVTFPKYWESELNKALKKAVRFSLKKQDGKVVVLNSGKGKWMLVDFWGIWCSSCKEELPQMEAFYKEVTAKYTGKLEIIAVACRDTEPKVTEFMKKNNYSFPWVMADNKIEKDYKISGYPTKVLITPQGRYLKIPFGVDWIKRIKLYIGL